jgi:hypothetical protein
MQRFRSIIPRVLKHNGFKSSMVRKFTSEIPKNKPLEPQPSKFRQLWDKYGWTAVIVHLTLYSFTLLGIYIGITEGYFKGKDAVDLLKTLHFDSFVDMDNMNPKTTGLGLAWVLTKFTEPIRLPMTLLITPLIARQITAFLRTFRK